MNLETQKLIDELKKDGIDFSYDLAPLSNVIFSTDNKEFKILSDLFFRKFGLSTIFKGEADKKNYVVPMKVSDKMFYLMMKDIIKMKFSAK